jgi:SAM-dependent methyltransferase
MNPLYRRGAGLYDLVHSNEDYQAEAAALHDIIQNHVSEDKSKLLDAGCGTGSHIKHLVDVYDCTGFDISDQLVSIAREKVPEATFYQADMKRFSLGEFFDIITCLFNSICCAQNNEELQSIISRFANHLDKEGIIVIQKTNGSLVDDPDASGSSVNTHESDQVKATRAKTWERRGKQLYQQTGFHIVRDGLLEALFRAITSEPGNKVNYNKLGRDLDAQYKTVRKYVDTLTQSFLLTKSKRFEDNTLKTYKKRPKLYAGDHAFCTLEHTEEGLRAEKVAHNHLRVLGDTGYWETQRGEVDIILKQPSTTSAYEVKYQEQPEETKSMEAFRREHPDIDLTMITKDTRGDNTIPLWQLLTHVKP